MTTTTPAEAETGASPEAGHFVFSPETEFHTSDLTASCMRTVQLKHEGKAIGEYTTSLYRGQIAHAMLEFIHGQGVWDAGAALEWARVNVARTAQDEMRPLSKSVRENREDIEAEAAKHVQHYVDRLEGYYAKCKIIGVELPIRMVMEMPDGQPDAVFASHLDLLYRDEHGQLCVEDWKHQDDAPTMAFLGRNLQFAVYYLMVAYGEVRVSDDPLVGPNWNHFGAFPDFRWVDLARFKAYTKKTETKDPGTGELVTYKKGDERPLDNIVKRWTFSPDREQEIRRELATRVLMFRHGLFPTNPDKLGCHICECQQACPAFHKD